MYVFKSRGLEARVRGVLVRTQRAQAPQDGPGCPGRDGSRMARISLSATRKARRERTSETRNELEDQPHLIIAIPIAMRFVRLECD